MPHIAINGWFWNHLHAGSGQYVRRLLAAMRKLDKTAQFTLILPPHITNPDEVPPDVNIAYTGSFASRGNIGKVWFEQMGFPNMVKKIGADLAHVPYWGAPLSCAVPLVTSVLDVIPILYPIYAMGVFNRLYLELVSTSARGSNHILTLSETSKLDIEYWLNIPKDNITVTYLAPDEQFHPRIGKERDAEVRAKYNLPDKFVLYLGGFDKRKRVNELLLAYTYVTGTAIPLVIAGKEPQWDDGLFPNMRRYAAELGLEDIVQWIGFVDEADKPSLYRLAEVAVFPSEYEGFGLPPLEAMACGTPVVASDAVIFDEVLEDGAYLVKDAREMGAAIISLLLQQPLRDAMVNQGIAQVTRYHWRKTAQKTLDVYAAVLSK